MASYIVRKGSMVSDLKPIPIDPRSTFSDAVKKRMARKRRAVIFTNSRQINGEIAGTKAALCIR
jgi:hypothetical protein